LMWCTKPVQFVYSTIVITLICNFYYIFIVNGLKSIAKTQLGLINSNGGVFFSGVKSHSVLR